MKRPWLSRPENVRLLWRGFIAVLALVVALQVAVPVHGFFRAEAWFGFSALFGFLACVGMVLFARLLGVFLKRRDDYYEDGRGDV
ncbi:MAG TPA: hypothetical protein VFR29_00670 [Steroidobacteraceae bacterium]|nr:hypothetical protein [Steroidobacteraceae bacterium]